jgi:NitT/TauT family transport system substrate-binding protein
MITRDRAIALLVAGTCSAGFPVPANAQSRTPLRVAVTPSEDGVTVHSANEMGFFARNGLDVEVTTMQGNPQIASALVGGAIDIGHNGVDTLAQAHAKGIPFVMVAPGGQYLSSKMQGIGGIFVPMTSSARRPKDLTGKTIGVASLQGLTATMTRAFIDKDGGDSSTLKFLELPIPAMAPALAGARIDGAFISEPFMDDARKNGRAIATGMDAIAKQFLVTCWCTTLAWAKAHPDLIPRFSAAMHDAAVWANQNQEKADAIFAKYTKLEPSVIARMTHGVQGEQLTPQLIQPFIDASAKYNNFTPFPAQELIYRAT